MTNSPLVSIVLVTYNSAEFVVETLESIKSQSYENIELIISDDASRDDTLLICNEWLKNNNERFQSTKVLTVETNNGISSNCNRGIKASSGEWIKLFAGDDILLKDCILSNINYAQSNTEIEVIASQMINFYIENERIQYESFLNSYVQKRKIFFDPKNTAKDQFNLLIDGKHVSFTPTLFYKKSLLEKMNFFDENYFIEDQPFLLKITKLGFKIGFIESDTVLYRVNNPNSASSGNSSVNSKFINDIQRLYIEFIKENGSLNARYEWKLLILRLKMMQKIKNPVIKKISIKVLKCLSPKFLKHSFTNLFASRRIINKLRNIHFRFKGVLLKLFLIACGCKVGKKLKCKQFPIFRSIPNSNIEIGNNVNLGYNISLDISTGKLFLGNNVNLTQDILISSIKSVTIGENSLIAENVSIRDGDHQFVIGKTINSQGLDADEIIIGKDVWIGAGVRVLKGSNLKDGCIIAANAVVTNKFTTEENTIYAGIPIKEISKRK